jgi:hypothetical protein
MAACESPPFIDPHVSSGIKWLRRRGFTTYKELAERLTALGMPETKASISNKISRGGFPASFLLASMKAIGVEALRLDDP